MKKISLILLAVILTISFVTPVFTVGNVDTIITDPETSSDFDDSSSIGTEPSVQETVKNCFDFSIDHEKCVVDTNTWHYTSFSPYFDQEKYADFDVDKMYLYDINTGKANISGVNNEPTAEEVEHHCLDVSLDHELCAVDTDTWHYTANAPYENQDAYSDHNPDEVYSHDINTIEASAAKGAPWECVLGWHVYLYGTIERWSYEKTATVCRRYQILDAVTCARNSQGCAYGRYNIIREWTAGHIWYTNTYTKPNGTIWRMCRDCEYEKQIG